MNKTNSNSNNDDDDDDNHVNRTAIFNEFPSSFPLSSDMTGF